jgi:hypothetical protein
MTNKYFVSDRKSFFLLSEMNCLANQGRPLILYILIPVSDPWAFLEVHRNVPRRKHKNYLLEHKSFREIFLIVNEWRIQSSELLDKWQKCLQSCPLSPVIKLFLKAKSIYAQDWKINLWSLNIFLAHLLILCYWFHKFSEIQFSPHEDVSSLIPLVYICICIYMYTHI